MIAVPDAEEYFAEAESWDADRVRERTGCPVRDGLLRSHNVAAVADSTGEMVAYSEVVANLSPEDQELIMGGTLARALKVGKYASA